MKHSMKIECGKAWSETSLLWVEVEDTQILFSLIAASPSQPPTKATQPSQKALEYI